MYDAIQSVIGPQPHTAWLETSKSCMYHIRSHERRWITVMNYAPMIANLAPQKCALKLTNPISIVRCMYVCVYVLLLVRIQPLVSYTEYPTVSRLLIFKVHKTILGRFLSRALGSRLPLSCRNSFLELNLPLEIEAIYVRNGNYHVLHNYDTCM